MGTACSSTPSTTSTQPPSLLLGHYSYTPALTHLTSRAVVFSDTQFPDSGNPLFASSNVDFEVKSALWASPVFYDEQFHVHPDQLTEVPLPTNGDVQDNGKTIIMHLRHDLRWSDGQPILASDFEYWWHLNQDPATGAVITSGYDQIASIETPDRFTIVLHMKHPFGPYLFYLPYAAPRHAWQQLQDIDLQNTVSVYQAPEVSNGPYMLAKYVNGQSYTLIPNLYYTSTTFHGPFISQLIYQSASSVATLSTALQKQQIDVAQGYMEYDLPALAHLSPAVKVLITPAASYEHLDFNNANSLFQDRRVRQAIQMAIDTCGLLKDVLHTSDCSRRVSQVEPLPSLVYDSTIKAATYAPTRAKSLLIQSGWLLDAQGLLSKHGQPFVLHLATTANNPLRIAVAEKIRQYLLAIGIQVKIVYYSLNTFFAVYTRGGILAKGAYDMALFTYANVPEPDDEYTAFHSSQIPTADHPDLGNYARVNDLIVDQSLTRARSTVIFADRVKFYHQFLERLASQVYIIPLYTDVNILTVSERMHNVIPNPNQFDNNWNIADWWTT
ncbi:MAG: peptide ABC transporter substrate-binding protein [Ktedonobacteraceae bacterium]